jgi:hypothetical protein
MRIVFKIFLIVFALIGVYASFRTVATTASKKRLIKVYECNCQHVKLGMGVKDAIKIMQRGIDPDYRAFSYEITFSGNEPYELFLAYSVHRGKYIVTIHYDKNTGQVTKISCPPKECAN